MKKILLLILAAICFSCTAQNTAERLGYDKDAILLILHADDLGVSHAENAASIDAYEGGGINSASIMVPCPWFPEIADYAIKNPDFDLGLHLTLTAEWKNYKWDGVSATSIVPSLLNDQQHFYSSSEEVSQKANLAEVEKEIRAQVERAIAFGVIPTHLDSHMGSLFQTPELFKVYQKVGADYKIPVFIPYGSLKAAPALIDAIQPGQVVVDNLAMIGPEVSPEDWGEFYQDIIRKLQPGLNEIIVHLAYDNTEMQAVTVDHPDFGAAWRQRDYDVVMSEEFKNLINELNVKLVTWRQIQQLQYPD